MNNVIKWKYHNPNGFGPRQWAVWTWRRDCLAGHPTKPDCVYCQEGEWDFTLFKPIDRYVYKRHYKLWYWWHNRPNSRAKRFLRAKFPNLN